MYKSDNLTKPERQSLKYWQSQKASQGIENEIKNVGISVGINRSLQDFNQSAVGDAYCSNNK
jgi:hypothetical protein